MLARRTRSGNPTFPFSIRPSSPARNVAEGRRDCLVTLRRPYDRTTVYDASSKTTIDIQTNRTRSIIIFIVIVIMINGRRGRGTRLGRVSRGWCRFWSSGIRRFGFADDRLLTVLQQRSINYDKTDKKKKPAFRTKKFMMEITGWERVLRNDLMSGDGIERKSARTVDLRENSEVGVTCNPISMQGKRVYDLQTNKRYFTIESVKSRVGNFDWVH